MDRIWMRSFACRSEALNFASSAPVEMKGQVAGEQALAVTRSRVVFCFLAVAVSSTGSGNGPSDPKTMVQGVEVDPVFCELLREMTFLQLVGRLHWLRAVLGTYKTTLTPKPVVLTGVCALFGLGLGRIDLFQDYMILFNLIVLEVVFLHLKYPLFLEKTYLDAALMDSDVYLLLPDSSMY
ncbi:hypothetical protein AAC387_Pa02g1947 [Persea americana]